MKKQGIPPAIDGFSEWKIESWGEFLELFNSWPLENTQNFIFRGQKKACWELTSSLNRLVAEANRRISKQHGVGLLTNVDVHENGNISYKEIESPSVLSGIEISTSDRLIESHYENFKCAIRGRVDTAELQTLLKNEDELVALGQHYGLATSFLDWTTSPFIATFFAFEEACNDCNVRAVYALDRSEIVRKRSDLDGLKSVKIVNPQLGENKRLISQGGLFVSIPRGINLEKWVKDNFEGSKEYILIKL